MRLPTLAMALTCLMQVISREGHSRLGHAVKTSRAAAAWEDGGRHVSGCPQLPLDDGLRPRPIIALNACGPGAGGRRWPVLLPVTMPPSCLISRADGHRLDRVALPLVAIGPLRTILHRRSRRFGVLPLVAPILAAATVTAIPIFRDQTFAGEIQANLLKSAVGSSLKWFPTNTSARRLFMARPRRPIARRFAVLALVLALAVSVAAVTWGPHSRYRCWTSRRSSASRSFPSSR
ncbi:arabinosyltransferase domain-containing protein [Mycobacterium tuberculosis]|uniref:arabinosyltransferase domain-containing protein n=1 Tax=Mycobacterium tuberculosis TaxID=1773 RepID=UPI0032B5B2C4